MLAYYIVHNVAGPAGFLVNFVIYIVLVAILFLVLKEVASAFNVNPRIINLVGLLLFLMVVLALLAGCSTAQRQRDAKEVKSFLNSTDVSVSGSYDGVTVTGRRLNGRNAVDVGVDAKEVVNAISR